MHSPLENPAFIDAIVILGAAGIVIPAFARFRITPIIGFILVGVLLGPSGLGSLGDQYSWLQYVTINDRETIEPFAEMGIILLLFSIGLELSFKRLWSLRRLVFGVGAAELLASGLLIGSVLYLLGQNSAGALGLGLALALSSTALVLPMSGTKSPVGRAALAMLLFEDVAIVPIIFLLGAISPAITADGGWDDLGRTLLMGGAVIIGMLVLGRLLLPRIFAQAARTKSPELFLAVSLLVIILASLATGATGLSPIVGALLAGLLIAETEYHGEVEVITQPFKGLALGVFLITVGMQIDIRVIMANWSDLLIAVVGVVLIKAIVTSSLLRFAGARPGTATEAGVLMSSPSETTLIVLAAATQAQLIQPQTAAFWQIVTAIGLTITPLLARFGHDIARRMEMRSDGGAAADEKPVEAQQTIIIGFGRVGKLIADLLTTHDQKYLAVETNIDTVAKARREGYPIMFGNVARNEMLDRLRLGHAKALVLTMDEPVLSVQIVKKVRAWVPDLPIIARARDIEHAAELYQAGATNAVPEALEGSLQLSEAVLVENGVAMGPVIASIHEVRDIYRKRIQEEGDLEYEPKLKSMSTSTGQATADDLVPDGLSPQEQT
ncbi:cation:proton antiporter domain-containing protein [Sphingorhabdus sp. 109]|jgi:CPA2 family monovalent cation:H+ antiporter-2|uniref:cation:proton antiporter domain-containing protein n=1 Tax=Sphingorhabdus sp. 109 TaxID=2653173 RepID=UPI0012F4336B|nr:cation:proton antiporter [Sphingorhabdus sp. 109]VWX56497.1 Glutathione-regulated potassium-efflux system protein KefC [Sphingorhabdus sp. 109]